MKKSVNYPSKQVQSNQKRRPTDLVAGVIAPATRYPEPWPRTPNQHHCNRLCNRSSLKTHWYSISSINVTALPSWLAALIGEGKIKKIYLNRKRANTNTKKKNVYYVLTFWKMEVIFTHFFFFLFFARFNFKVNKLFHKFLSSI